MGEKVKVEVFGIRDQAAGGGCGCGGDCGPQQTMGEIYEELVIFINKSKLKDQVDLQFIDILDDNMDGHDKVREVLEKGYGIPLTAVAGTLRFHSGISNKMIYEAIQEALR